MTNDAAAIVGLGPPTAIGPFLVSGSSASGSIAFNSPCGSGAVATGNFASAGAYIDSLGLFCGKPSLVP